jgi:hypothetical protein
VADAARYIRMPTDECEETVQRMFEKYHLPDLAYAVDGMLVRFDGAVRGLPVAMGCLCRTSSPGRDSTASTPWSLPTTPSGSAP